MNLIESPLFLFLTIILLIAAVIDIRFHKIPNWVTFPTMIAAIVGQTSMKGFEGLLFSLEGIGVGIAILIIPYLMGGMGAGDAKLMGAVGGILGPKGVFTAFLFAAIMGGIYAVVLLALHGYLKETAKRYGTILKTFILTQQLVYIPSPTKKEKKPRLYYGLAIGSGTLICVFSGISIW